MSGRNWTSGSWYRVASFRPRLRAHVRFHRHIYRGKVWYVLQDRASGRFQRFTPEAYRVVSMMDGYRTLDDLWETAAAHMPVDAMTQDELVRLVGQLYSADVLVGDVPPDVMELSERGRRGHRQKLVRSMLNPLAIRVPLIDPDEFMNAVRPVATLLVSWFGAIVFLVVVAYGILLAALNWGPLTEDVVDRTLTAQNIVLLLLAYPVVKALHELGHALVIKRWGGSVHEIGIMFLVFLPVPYVDASDSIAFPSKWRRALVGAAGILVEIFLAAIAMIVWTGAEEGLVRAFAFNVMLIGGVSTLLFNGNPLLRFDGYYVLCDLIEIPNLGQRANKYLGYLVQRHAFGLEWAENPVTGRGEAGWLFSYAVLAWLYRLIIMAGIIALVATRFFVIGVFLAVWALFLMMVLPILKGFWFVLASPALRRRRGRAFALTGGFLAAIAAFIMVLPLPYYTVAEGVVVPVPDSYVNAQSDGVVEEVFVKAGERVQAGTPLLRISEPLLNAQRDILAARITEIQRRLDAQTGTDQTTKRIMEEELSAAQADLAATEARISDQIVRAGMGGQVIFPVEADLVGRFAQRGDLLAVVASFEDPVIRVVVPETAADLVRNETRGMEVRFVQDSATARSARVVRAAPGLSRSLPSMALATEGGGRAALDTSAPRGEVRSLLSYYQMDLALEQPVSVSVYGGRVHVRFDHGEAPLAGRLYRAGTRVFLKYFASPEGAI